MKLQASGLQLDLKRDFGPDIFPFRLRLFLKLQTAFKTCISDFILKFKRRELIRLNLLKYQVKIGQGRYLLVTRLSSKNSTRRKK